MSQQEGGMPDEAGRPQARPERPRTAGRRPPKVASKVKESSEQTSTTQAGAGPVIIAEGNQDDDEDLYQAQADPSGSLPVGRQIQTEEGGQHGKLVNDLLGAKKKEEEKERLKREEEETREEFDDGQSKGGIRMGKLKRKKDAASNNNEVDVTKLGEAIQSLCQAANPLGKSIDLVHQDIAHMGKELDNWKQEYRDASDSYQMQLKQTEEMLLPLYQKVAELDDSISEMKNKIRNSRSRIARNDQTIQSLLESVVLAK